MSRVSAARFLRGSDAAKRSVPIPHLIVIAVLAVGRLTLSLLVYQNPSPAYYPDSDDYEPLGLGLLEGTSYRWEANEEAELFRPPGYPAFVALVYGALGRHPGNLALVQLGLGGIVALLLYDAVRRLLSPRFGLIAAALYLADPFSAVWALPVLSDTLFSTLLLVSLYGLIRWRQSGGGYWLVLAGIVGGIGSLVRPIGLLSLPLWAIFILLAESRDRPSGHALVPRGALKNSMVFGVAFLAIVTPWSIRNQLLWKSFGVSSVTQYNLEYYLAPSAIAERDGLSLDQARSQLDPPAELTGLSRSLWHINVIRDNLLPYLKAHLRGVVHTALGLEYIRWFAYAGVPAERLDLATELRSGGPLSALALLLRGFAETPPVAVAYTLSLAYQLLLYAASTVGFVELHRRARWTGVLLLATGLALILSPGPVGEPRFRDPVQPVLALFAAASVEAVLRRRLSVPGRRHLGEVA